MILYSSTFKPMGGSTVGHGGGTRASPRAPPYATPLLLNHHRNIVIILISKKFGEGQCRLVEGGAFALMVSYSPGRDYVYVRVCYLLPTIL